MRLCRVNNLVSLVSTGIHDDWAIGTRTMNCVLHLAYSICTEIFRSFWHENEVLPRNLNQCVARRPLSFLNKLQDVQYLLIIYPEIKRTLFYRSSSA